MLMGAHDRAVDHGVFIVGVARQMLEKSSPHAGLGPSRKPGVRLDRVAETLGKIAPRNSRAIAVEDGLNEQPIVARGHSDMPNAPGQQVPNSVPLIVAKSVAAQGQPPIRLTPYESYDSLEGNPVIEDRP